MNKKEMIAAIEKESGVAKKDIEKVLKGLTTVVMDEVKNGEKIVLGDIGAFKSAERKERVVRNPRTGEKSVSPAVKVVKFVAAKKFKDFVK